ncbi:hypothetical protein Z043-106911 [Arapaima gigas]
MTDLCPAEDSLLPLSGKDQHEETLKLTSLCPETNKESVFQVDEGYFTRHFSFGAESTGSQYYILKELLSAGEVNSSFSASEVALLCNQSEVEVVGAASLEQQVDTEAVEREATLKKRVAELEKQLEAAVCAHPQETQEQYTSDLRETIQLCETLMCEKAAIAADRDLIEQEFHALHEETQALRQEKEYLLRELEEKREVEEFRALEQESTRQYEKELLSEIISLKKAADKSATHVQNVESDIAAMSAELKRKEEWIMELQPLQNKDSAQEIRQLKRSLEDAETLNRDTKKEWAMLRTEMLALREKEVMRKRVVELEKAQVEAEDRVSTHKEAAQLLQIELQDAYAQLEEKDITISILEQKLAENQLDGGIALREMSNLEFQMDLERTALTAKHQEEVRKMAALLHSKEVTIKTLMEALGRMQKPADHQSLTESTRGRAVLSPMLVVQEEEVKQAKSDHYDGHVTTQRGQAAKWRRRATKLKENWSEVSSHTTPTRGHCISPSEGYLFESPKNKFFDGRNKTVPLSRPRQFFDNSSLGTIPEVAFPPTENGWAHLKDLSASVEDERELEPLSPKHDDNCKTQ